MRRRSPNPFDLNEAEHLSIFLTQTSPILITTRTQFIATFNYECGSHQAAAVVGWSKEYACAINTDAKGI